MSQALSWTPKPWLAAVLNFFFPSAGFLYGANIKLAAIYFLLVIFFSVVGPFFIHASDWWSYFGLGISVVGIIHAYQNAKRPQTQTERPWYSRVAIIISAYLLLLAALFMVRVFFYETFRLPSTSMAPTLPRGTKIIVKKWGYGNYQTYGIQIKQTPITAELRRGDVVVFIYPRDPTLTYIKRLIGLPGDVVSYKDKVLSINGKAVTQEPAGSYLDEERLQYFKIVKESIDGVSYSTFIDEKAPIYHGSQESISFPRKEACNYESNGFTCKVPPDSYFMLGDNRDNSLDSRYWGFVSSSQIVGVLSYVFK
jgi:signal peptidase I